jgi:hypothetical protein
MAFRPRSDAENVPSAAAPAAIFDPMPDHSAPSGPVKAITRFAGPWRALLASTLVGSLLALGPGPGTAALPAAAAEARACGGKLQVSFDVQTRFPRLYAAQFKKRMRVWVHRRGGPISAWQVQVYTFQGKLLGKSKRNQRLASAERANVRLRFPMQAGRYTVLVKGFHAGCSAESVKAEAVRFSECEKRLPLKFPSQPGGDADDYGGFLSVPVVPKDGALIRRPRSEVYSFAGQYFGRSINDYKAIFGRAVLDNRLTRPLRPGGYTVIVRGRVDQPRSCGLKRKELALEFD